MGQNFKAKRTVFAGRREYTTQFLVFLYIPRFNEIIVFSLYNFLTQFMNNLVLYLTPKVIEHAFFCLLKNVDGTFSSYERKRTTPLLEVSILNCSFVSWTNKLCNLHVRVESNIEFEPFLITSLKRLKLEDYYSLSRPHI